MLVFIEMQYYKIMIHCSLNSKKKPRSTCKYTGLFQRKKIKRDAQDEIEKLLVNGLFKNFKNAGYDLEYRKKLYNIVLFFESYKEQLFAKCLSFLDSKKDINFIKKINTTNQSAIIFFSYLFYGDLCFYTLNLKQKEELKIFYLTDIIKDLLGTSGQTHTKPHTIYHLFIGVFSLNIFFFLYEVYSYLKEKKSHLDDFLNKTIFKDITIFISQIQNNAKKYEKQSELCLEIIEQVYLLFLKPENFNDLNTKLNTTKSTIIIDKNQYTN